jgi:hypothetical protein
MHAPFACPCRHQVLNALLSHLSFRFASVCTVERRHLPPPPPRLDVGQTESRSCDSGSPAVKLGKSKDECVKVCVRIRPLSNKEKQDGRVVIAIAGNKSGLVTVKNPRGDDSEPPKTFTFSACNCFLSRLSCTHPTVVLLCTGTTVAVCVLGIAAACCRVRPRAPALASHCLLRTKHCNFRGRVRSTLP